MGAPPDVEVVCDAFAVGAALAAPAAVSTNVVALAPATATVNSVRVMRLRIGGVLP